MPALPLEITSAQDLEHALAIAEPLEHLFQYTNHNFLLAMSQSITPQAAKYLRRWRPLQDAELVAAMATVLLDHDALAGLAPAQQRAMVAYLAGQVVLFQDVDALCVMGITWTNALDDLQQITRVDRAPTIRDFDLAALPRLKASTRVAPDLMGPVKASPEQIERVVSFLVPPSRRMTAVDRLLDLF